MDFDEMSNAKDRAQRFFIEKSDYQPKGHYSLSESATPAPRVPASYGIVKDVDGTYLIIRSSNGHPARYEVVLRGYSSYETHRVYKLLIESESK